MGQGMAAPTEPIDIIYTWVDDSFPGYLDLLNRFADDARDLNPNRTRDNLDVIRYSMRSVWRNLPNIRRIYLLTCRPQVPPWLDTNHPSIRVVHHDEVMAAEILPTFNSFCIVSHLHLLPDLTQRFLYFEDDILAMSPDLMTAMFAPDGRPIAHFQRAWVLPRSKLNPKSSSPWNLALANADAALSSRYGPGPRRHTIHGPVAMDVAVSEAMCREFADEIAATRASPFRAGDNVPPEVLIQHYMAETEQGHRADWNLSKRVEGYVSIENFAPWTWLQLQRIEARSPMTVTLNDSFGARPNPRVVAMVRARLKRWFPEPAPWEKDAAK